MPSINITPLGGVGFLGGFDLGDVLPMAVGFYLGRRITLKCIIYDLLVESLDELFSQLIDMRVVLCEQFYGLGVELALEAGLSS